MKNSKCVPSILKLNLSTEGTNPKAKYVLVTNTSNIDATSGVSIVQESHLSWVSKSTIGTTINKA